MKTRLIRRSGAVAAAAAMLLGGASMAKASVGTLSAGAPLTTGPAYDRNPSVVQDGAVTRLFFTRSELSPCNRLAGCNADHNGPDNTTYDLYEKDSTDGGQTWGGEQFLADNSQFPASPWNNPSYGRTVAATRTASGAIHLFWASGGDTSSLVYGVKPANSNAWTWNSRADLPVFNVEAVAKGDTTYVYYEDGAAGGIYAMTFTGSSFTTPQLAVANASIPKAIVDAAGMFRLTAVDARAWPFVDVLVASSTDGLTFGPPTVAVPGNGTVTNWDPSLVQTPDGAYHLFYAPQHGDAPQLIAHRSSPTFEGLAAATDEQVTTGTDGTTPYWDYWPEATVVNGVLRLFYTSEAATSSGGSPGTAHIWTTSTSVKPDNRDQCKNGGYAAFGFPNQGQCVSSVSGKGK